MWHIDTESLIFKSDSDVEATYITMSISGALCAEIPCEVLVTVVYFMQLK